MWTSRVTSARKITKGSLYLGAGLRQHGGRARLGLTISIPRQAAPAGLFRLATSSERPCVEAAQHFGRSVTTSRGGKLH